MANTLNISDFVNTIDNLGHYEPGTLAVEHDRSLKQFPAVIIKEDIGKIWGGCALTAQPGNLYKKWVTGEKPRAIVARTDFTYMYNNTCQNTILDGKIVMRVKTGSTITNGMELTLQEETIVNPETTLSEIWHVVAEAATDDLVIGEAYHDGRLWRFGAQTVIVDVFSTKLKKEA